MEELELRVYATCPQSKDVGAAEYADRVADVARWSEEAGCHGILVHTDNRIVDPYLTPSLPAELAHVLTISGSSPAGLAAAEEIGALAVR